MAKKPVDVIKDGMSVQQVIKMLTTGHIKQQADGDPKKIASNSQTNSDYQNSMVMKAISKQTTMGGFAFLGELKNSVKFAQQVGAPEQFAKSFAMATNLLNVAEQGKNILANKSVGGLENIMAAINFASAFQAATAKQNQANQKDPYEEYLKALYRETTQLEPLDAAGKPTPEYTLWRTLYLASLDLLVSEAFLQLCRDVVALKRFNITFLRQVDLKTLVG